MFYECSCAKLCVVVPTSVLPSVWLKCHEKAHIPSEEVISVAYTRSRIAVISMTKKLMVIVFCIRSTKRVCCNYM